MLGLRYLTVLSILFVSTAANSAIVQTYVSKPTFLSDTGAISATGVLPNSGNVGTSVTLGDLTFTNVNTSANKDIFVGTGNTSDWTSRTPGNDIAFSGNEDFNISLSTPALSFGFDVVEPDGTLDVNGFANNSIFEIALFSGGSSGTLIGSDQFTLLGSVFGNDLVEFIGVTTDSAFDFITVREIVSPDGNTNDYFSGFVTAAAVPIPASIWLFGTAIMGLMGLNRKR